MLKTLLIGTALVLPVNAMAQTTTPAEGATPQVAQTAASLAEGVPTPRLETTVDGYRVAAIAAGAVVGVIVANYLTGGMITPVLLAGTGEAGMVAAVPAVTEASVLPAVAEASALAVPEASTGTYATAQAAVTAAGGMIGGYFGNWVYGE